MKTEISLSIRCISRICRRTRAVLLRLGVSLFRDLRSLRCLTTTLSLHLDKKLRERADRFFRHARIWRFRFRENAIQNGEETRKRAWRTRKRRFFQFCEKKDTLDVHERYNRQAFRLSLGRDIRTPRGECHREKFSTWIIRLWRDRNGLIWIGN